MTSKMIDAGVKVSGSLISSQDKIWSKYSDDKVDIGETLARVLRTLAKALPLSRPLRALSIGSSNEPQFRLLQTSFLGGLYLVDIDRSALDAVQERISRQHTTNVATILRDYTEILLTRSDTDRFRRGRLGGDRMDLVTLQHSMYYCPMARWMSLMRSLYDRILAPRGAIYCVLMSARSDDPRTTTWLYNHFAGRFCGHHNDQDLLELKGALRAEGRFARARILSKTSRVRCFVDDFEKFMAIVWMILLYPHVHRYTLEQRQEITEHMYRNFFEKKRPLIQDQDHLVIYRGLGPRGLI